MMKSPLKWLLAGLVILSAGSLIWFWRQPPSQKIIYKNYPYGSFKIPEDVLKEKIATVSAKNFRLPIIMYHYVEYVQDKNDKLRIALNTTPSVLDWQIKSLTDNHYNFFFARDVPDIISGKITLPAKPIFLTFDDGYEDFYYYAFPILKKYQTKATIYIMYNFLNRRGYLNVSQVKEIIKSGLVEVASHTLDHYYLKNSKESTAWSEIYDNKIQLEKLFKISVPSFAYPYGAFDEPSLELVKKAGHTNAVSVIPGTYQSENNLFYLSRIRPGNLYGTDPAKGLEDWMVRNNR